MNAVDPVHPASVPVAYPSMGALIGSVLGEMLVGKLGFNPADPVTGAPIAGAIAAVASGLFNQVGKWLHLS